MFEAIAINGTMISLQLLLGFEDHQLYSHDCGIVDLVEKGMRRDKLYDAFAEII